MKKIKYLFIGLSLVLISSCGTSDADKQYLRNEYSKTTSKINNLEFELSHSESEIELAKLNLSTLKSNSKSKEMLEIVNQTIESNSNRIKKINIELDSLRKVASSQKEIIDQF